ncbi:MULTISPECIES: YdcH family protein [Amniculibacterium]|uniref:YdcH family protein n=1 Tax=Amniculibacterium TaxID=2715289 RepID=UPI000F598A3E|nr:MULTISPECIES: YdcH family protein [Amniculibacterium]
MENHTLAHDFPEHIQKITELKVSDENFKKMFVNYEELNALILHYEKDEVNHTTDDHLTDLRKKRMHLKDELYAYLTQ